MSSMIRTLSAVGLLMLATACDTSYSNLRTKKRATAEAEFALGSAGSAPAVTICEPRLGNLASQIQERSPIPVASPGSTFLTKRGKETITQQCAKKCISETCNVCYPEVIDGIAATTCHYYGVADGLGFTLRLSEPDAARGGSLVVDQPGGPGSVGEPGPVRAAYLSGGLRYADIIWSMGATGVSVGAPFTGMFSRQSREPVDLTTISRRHAGVLDWIHRKHRLSGSVALTACSAGSLTMSTAYLFHGAEKNVDFTVFNGSPGNFDHQMMCSGSKEGELYRDFAGPHLASGINFKSDAYYWPNMLFDYISASSDCKDGRVNPVFQASGINTATAAYTLPSKPVAFVIAEPAGICDANGDGKADLMTFSTIKVPTKKTCNGPINAKCDDKGEPILDQEGRFQIDETATCYCNVPGRSLEQCGGDDVVPRLIEDPRGNYYDIPGSATLVNKSDVQSLPVAQAMRFRDIVRENGNSGTSMHFVAANHCGGPTATRSCELVCDFLGKSCDCDRAFASELGQ